MATGSKPSTNRNGYVPKHAPARATKKSTKKSFLRRRWWLLLLLTPVALALLGSVALYVAYARIKLPDRLPPIQTTYLYDRNGAVLSTLHGAVDRTVIPLSRMSPNIRDAVIATEDHAFYSHPGVDVGGILRAAYTDLVKRQTVQGASTITEQLVKNVYAGTYSTDPQTGQTEYVQPTRSISEKIREALLAVKLEKELGKDKILAQYLNTVYFGHGAYGIQAAAETYFGKPANELTRARVGDARRRAARARPLRPDRPAVRQPVPTGLRAGPDGALRVPRRRHRGEAEGDALLRHGEGREQRDDRRARPGRVLRGLHAPDPRRTLRRGEGLRRRPPRHDLARPRHATRRRAGDRGGTAGPEARSRRRARGDGSVHRADPRDGRRPELEGEQGQLRDGGGRLGPSVGVGVQGLHAGRGDAGRLQPERVLVRAARPSASRTAPTRRSQTASGTRSTPATAKGAPSRSRAPPSIR